MNRAAVIDCSGLFDTLVLTRVTSLTGRLATLRLCAPNLIDYEFLAALKRSVALGRIGASDATDKLQLFEQLDIERHGIDLLRERMWSLRHSFSPYDAGYVVLAEALDLPLVTSDLRLAVAAERYCEVLTP